nr:alpha-E domain-containing protein [Marinicauda salina]
MLSRFAEHAFWLGRYVERAENLARLLAVTESFAAGDDDEAAWASLLHTFVDAEAFAATGKRRTGLNVARWYLIDRTNPGSAVSALGAARENARALRHLIPVEIWKQINMLYGEMAGIRSRQVSLPKLNGICERIRLGCQTHQGIVDGAWYRDEAWLFHRIGCELERADQTTRLVDVKYYQLHGDAEIADDEDAPRPDIVWWNSLLRSASGYHAFRRRYPLTAGPADAAGFLLFDSDFPRSVRLSALSAFDRLRELEEDYGAPPGEALAAARAQLLDRFADRPKRLIGRPLHTYLDRLQQDLIDVAAALRARYFDPGG